MTQTARTRERESRRRGRPGELSNMKCREQTTIPLSLCAFYVDVRPHGMTYSPRPYRYVTLKLSLLTCQATSYSSHTELRTSLHDVRPQTRCFVTSGCRMLASPPPFTVHQPLCKRVRLHSTDPQNSEGGHVFFVVDPPIGLAFTLFH